MSACTFIVPHWTLFIKPQELNAQKLQVLKWPADFKQTVEFTPPEELTNHENEFQGNVKSTKISSLIQSPSIIEGKSKAIPVTDSEGP